ncbi:hypothetical protein BHE74_00013276 [Ensete ventricosum]|nr:hypothetical protein BHE74_00013276 [Ensete ventricosum]
MGVKLSFTSLLLAMKLLLNCGVSFFYGGEESDAAATSCGGRAPRNLRDGNAPVKKDISGRGGEIKAVVEKKRKRASGRCSITEPARLSVTVLPLLVGHRGKVNRKEVTRGRKLETPNRGATSRGEDSKEGGGRKGKAVLRHRSSVMIPRLLFTCFFLRSGKAASVLYFISHSLVSRIRAGVMHRNQYASFIGSPTCIPLIQVRGAIHTLVLFLASRDVVQKSQDFSTNTTHSSSDTHTRK